MIHVNIVLSDLPNNRIGPIRPKVTKKLKILQSSANDALLKEVVQTH